MTKDEKAKAVARALKRTILLIKGREYYCSECGAWGYISDGTDAVKHFSSCPATLAHEILEEE